MRILIVRYKKTKSVFDGGEQASERNLKILQRIVGKDNVDTYFIHNESKKRTAMDYLMGAFYMLFGYYFGLTPARTKEIVLLSKSYDVVFIDRSIFGIIAKRLKQARYTGRIVAFFHNVEVIYFSAKYSNRYNPLRWLVLMCADVNDRYSCRYSDKIIALNNRDDDELHQRYRRRADVLIPIAFEDKYKRNTYPDNIVPRKPLCMFLGAYFPANVEGIEWFVRNVYPKVDIRLQIVGKDMAKLKDTDWIDNTIEIVSDAPALLPYFEAADIMILPIFKGSGMKVKTCESLMYGKNIVATPEAWVGYDLDYSKAGACCNTADEFITAIKSISYGGGIRRFNEYSRKIFLEKYSADCMVEKFRMVIEK